ncbi:hypothetical protein DDZ14_09695 [Maritimibacter sp. 55A14]|uniref:glycosyltransferase n=1 Tax=Maritimibacter sp. 55A14 TaxID=2174844 RepID=UPI000D622B17|nr:glycosyltransferase [Maritimibacter sp. 55A14]PWE32654.1 hypothetical protein DDZ14_09695 [Maritimibacter sp. 55A14]
MAELPRIVICTRFSFWGKSGWKSEFSEDPGQLFDRDRLEARLALLELVALASLKGQSSQNFDLFLLTSERLPDWARERLEAICAAALPTERFKIVQAGFSPARRWLARWMKRVHGDAPVAQVVLDDDDGLASDYVETLETLLAERRDAGGLKVEALPHFVTFPRGYGLDLESQPPRLLKHNYRFINLGLTMIGRAQDKNIFAISHRTAPKRFGFTEFAERRMFVRSVHGLNDSRVTVNEKWDEVPDWDEDAEIRARFAFLLPMREC